MRRAYRLNGQYLVSVRYPFQWNDIRSFVTPFDSAVLEVYSQIGPDAWQCLDFVCRYVTYKRELGEMWQFPSETLALTEGDCEDSTFLFVSLARNFAPNVWAILGDYQGFGHAWGAQNGFIYETTYTLARPVPDPQDYCPYVYFSDQEVVELWPGALGEVFELKRDEATKLGLIAKAVG